MNRADIIASFHAGAASRYRPVASASGAGEAFTQVEAFSAEPEFVLHGCKVPGVLPNVRYYSVIIYI
jgi:hypothetical protein